MDCNIPGLHHLLKGVLLSYHGSIPPILHPTIPLHSYLWYTSKSGEEVSWTHYASTHLRRLMMRCAEARVYNAPRTHLLVQSIQCLQHISSCVWVWITWRGTRDRHFPHAPYTDSWTPPDPPPAHTSPHTHTSPMTGRQTGWAFLHMDGRDRTRKGPL